MVYRLTNKAEADIREIYQESRDLFGASQAERYFRNLTAVFETLAQNPRLARLRREIDPAVRIHPVGSHLVVYREDERDDILIIRIRHHRENWLGSS